MATLHTYSGLGADIAARAEELTVKGFDEAQHPRDEHGRFGSGASEGTVSQSAEHVSIDGVKTSAVPLTEEEHAALDAYMWKNWADLNASLRDGKDLTEEQKAQVALLDPFKSAHKYSTVQLNLPTAVAQQVRAIGRQIADADLAEDGREQTPHVTVKFGIDTDDPADLLSLLSNQPPVRLRLGKLAVFDAAETGAAFDVLTVEVNSPDLDSLNKLIVDALPTTQTHDFYRPHATIAYLRAGKGEEYLALDNPLEGTTLTVDRLTFSNQDGEQTTIPLEGVGAMSNVNKMDDELYKSLQTGITARLSELKAEFNEEAHPRGEGGKFAAGGSSSSDSDKKDEEGKGHAWKDVSAALTEHLTPQEKTAVVSGLHQKLQTNEGPRIYQKQDIEKMLTRVGVGEKRREQVLSKLKSLVEYKGGPGSGPHKKEGDASELTRTANIASSKADRTDNRLDHQQAMSAHAAAQGAHAKEGDEQQAKYHQDKAEHHADKVRESYDRSRSSFRHHSA